jgi:hypothetical protein
MSCGTHRCDWQPKTVGSQPSRTCADFVKSRYGVVTLRTACDVIEMTHQPIGSSLVQLLELWALGSRCVVEDADC